MKHTRRTITLAITAVAVVAFAIVVYQVGNPFNSELAAAAAVSAPDSAAGSQAKSGLAAYDKNGDGIVYQDGMHPWYVQDEPGTAPDCGMDLTPVRVDGSAEAGTVKIDPVTVQNMGVRTATVSIESVGRDIRTTGRFVMDESGERGITLKVSGYIEKLYANYEGYRVRKGQPLLEIYSPDLVSTQEEYLLALQNVKRLEGTSSADDAQRLLEAARRRLAYWDLTEEQIRQIEESGTPHRTLMFYAPSSGEVMNKQVSEGEHVRAGQTLMEIVDISKIWLIADVYEQDLAWVKVGTPARIELPYNPGEVYQGRISYIYHMLDMQTRSAEARIVLPGGHNAPVKPGMYATVTLQGSGTEPSPVVPSEAVIRTGEEEVVILALGDGRFQPRKVTAGFQSGDKVQILEGLQGGERVVTSAQFLIDSEARLQSAIGAMAGVDAGETAVDGLSEGAIPQPKEGMQVVRVNVGSSGFEPQQIEVKAGTPARLVFTRTTDGTCAKQVQAPALGIAKTDLPLNEPVSFEVTPKEAGTFTFACGMDMLKGSIIVMPAS